MPDNAMLVHINYSKSYENKHQDYWQSAYFSHSTFSIFTAVAYIRCNWELLHESIVIISEAKDHSRIAADTCISNVIDIMMKKYPHLTSYMSVDLYVWSDQCSAKLQWPEERLSKAQRILQNVPTSSWMASIVIISRSNKWWKRQRASHLLVIHAHPYTHAARRQITRGGFHCVRLFHISSDREAFHDQWYKKAGRT